MLRDHARWTASTYERTYQAILLLNASSVEFVKRSIHPPDPSGSSTRPDPLITPFQFPLAKLTLRAVAADFVRPTPHIASTSPAETATTPSGFSTRTHPLTTPFRFPLTKRTLGAAAADFASWFAKKYSGTGRIAELVRQKFHRVRGCERMPGEGVAVAGWC